MTTQCRGRPLISEPAVAQFNVSKIIALFFYNFIGLRHPIQTNFTPAFTRFFFTCELDVGDYNQF